MYLRMRTKIQRILLSIKIYQRMQQTCHKLRQLNRPIKKTIITNQQLLMLKLTKSPHKLNINNEMYGMFIIFKLLTIITITKQCSK